MEEVWDVIVVGAGTSGIPAAIFAGKRGAKVLAIDSADKIGGTLHLSTGQMSAAGTALQKQLGINDSADAHFEDVMRISENTANKELVRLAVENAAGTFDWLMDNGFLPLKEHPVLGNAHEPYSERRYYWGPYAALSILEAMQPLLDTEIAKGNVTLSLETKLIRLIVSNNEVDGVEIEARDGTRALIKGRNVVLATGGYSSNPKLFKELSGPTLYLSGSYEHSQGDGLYLGQSVGGFLRGHDNYICGYGAILKDFKYPTGITARAICHPHLRQPWEIHVNKNGDRFFQEDYDSVHVREKKLLEQPNLMSWIVFDSKIRAESPPILRDFSKKDEDSFFSNHPMFCVAESMNELASLSGIDALGLRRTVNEYNDAIEDNMPDPFNRKHRPLLVKEPPFFSICTHGTSITSTVGLAVNKKLQVITSGNEPIENLYATGEILGSSQTMGKAACGGMMITPALTFGRLLGQELLQW